MSKPYLASNPNNNNNGQSVYYNGQAYTTKIKGGMSYIEVGNRTVAVDLNDPTWFLQFAHGDYAAKEKWEELDANLEKQKQPHKDWLAYYDELKEKSSQAWTNFKNSWHDACEQLYTANTNYRQTKKKYDSLMESAKYKHMELTVDEQADAKNYEEEMNKYTDQKKEYSADKSFYKRKQIAASAVFQGACIDSIGEINSLGRLEMQQIVCRRQADNL